MTNSKGTNKQRPGTRSQPLQARRQESAKERAMKERHRQKCEYQHALASVFVLSLVLFVLSLVLSCGNGSAFSCVICSFAAV